MYNQHPVYLYNLSHRPIATAIKLLSPLCCSVLQVTSYNLPELKPSLDMEYSSLLHTIAYLTSLSPYSYNRLLSSPPTKRVTTPQIKLYLNTGVHNQIYDISLEISFLVILSFTSFCQITAVLLQSILCFFFVFSSLTSQFYMSYSHSSNQSPYQHC